MINKKNIGIFIIAASKQMTDILLTIVEKDINLNFQGVSYDLASAVQTMKRKSVNVIIIDSALNNIDFDSVIKKIAEEYPVPIIFLLSTGQRIDSNRKDIPFETILKPVLGESLSGFVQELQVKIKIISMEKVDKTASLNIGTTKNYGKSNKIIAIGASTGGVEALSHVLHQFPETIAGIVIVQHIPPHFSRLFAERLNGSCKIAVKEARDGDEIKPGLALIAPGDSHMRVIKAGDKYIVKCYFGEKVSGHCPSVDVLFESVAESAGANAIGVILTGMGADGANGLLSMRKKGAYTIGQDKDSCVIYGMPMEAYKLGAVTKQVPLSGVARELIGLTK